MKVLIWDVNWVWLVIYFRVVSWNLGGVMCLCCCGCIFIEWWSLM